MSYHLSYEREGASFVTLRSVLPVGFGELTVALDALSASTAFPTTRAILLDLTTLEDGHVPQALALAVHLGRLPGWRSVPVALLVSGCHQAILERAFLLYLLHEGVIARLFPDLRLARAWLLASTARRSRMVGVS